MATTKRYAVGQMPVSGDFVVDALDGPRRIAVRGWDGEVVRHATREEAECHLANLRAEVAR